ncbi:hypothetical protein FKG94_06730 [Exilibacterium tricleocarpae]|uniref:Uncharacterized protein n=1 Tax=Exilibacterium tricleocarpae TaxID=2591008 RepID=A0A545TYZ0_9GAMM|nr:hypothetical protein [Exilibacterium tricleocarpae]TQV82435.1 hypothetical protein FKG94_06730 [Exilibacterium tricleocarpae]
MQKKEVLFVVLGAVLLSNLAIVGTLIAKGFFAGDKTGQVAADIAPDGDEPPGEEADPGAELGLAQVHGVNYLRQISEAMSICEDKFLTATSSIRKSYEFKDSESHFSAAEELYRVFIEYETLWEPNSPPKGFSVVCEVSAVTRAIASYKVLPL